MSSLIRTLAVLALTICAFVVTPKPAAAEIFYGKTVERGRVTGLLLVVLSGPSGAQTYTKSNGGGNYRINLNAGAGSYSLRVFGLNPLGEHRIYTFHNRTGAENQCYWPDAH